MKKILYIILASIFLYSCQSTKYGFTLKKKFIADEFLVEKKSPLVLPPEYGKLPTPEGEQTEENKSEENEIKILVSNDKETSPSNVEKNTKPTSIEESIIEKIK